MELMFGQKIATMQTCYACECKILLASLKTYTGGKVFAFFYRAMGSVERVKMTTSGSTDSSVAAGSATRGDAATDGRR